MRQKTDRDSTFHYSAFIRSFTLILFTLCDAKYNMKIKTEE